MASFVKCCMRVSCTCLLVLIFSVAVKQLLNHRFLKKEITELYGALARVEECLARAASLDARHRYCAPCAPRKALPEDDASSSSAMFPLLRRHAHRVVLVDLCCGKGVQVRS